MPCSICRQAGHNRSTCPHSLTGLPHTPGTILHNNPSPPHNPPPPNPQVTPGPTPPLVYLGPPPQRSVTTGPPLQRANQTGTALTGPNTTYTPRNHSSNSSRRKRKRWRRAIHTVLNLNKYSKIVLLWSHLGFDDPRIFYLSWIKVRRHLTILTPQTTASLLGRGHLTNAGIFQCVNNTCHIFYLSMNPDQVDLLGNDDLRVITLVNLRSENYLVYWVLGNYMVQDLDNQENAIRYMGLAAKGSTFDLRTMNGHRFYLVPHRLNTQPPYHPERDNQLFIEPYCQINIHDKTEAKIYIDEKDDLSELNKWKFNALKLDFLIKEVIKLGGKNNDILESVLDLHEDIKLGDCSEWLKDVAGIPSTFTNIT